MAATGKQGKKARKHGRKAKRSLSQMRYRTTGRSVINKAKRIFKMMKKHPKYRAMNLSDETKIELGKLQRRDAAGN
jgi:hypothetical protein